MGGKKDLRIDSEWWYTAKFKDNYVRDGMKTLQKEYKVDKTRIGFVKFIFEAYEGVAVITTLDPKEGHVLLSIAPDMAQEAFEIIEELKKDFEFNEI